MCITHTANTHTYMCISIPANTHIHTHTHTHTHTHKHTHTHTHTCVLSGAVFRDLCFAQFSRRVSHISTFYIHFTIKIRVDFQRSQPTHHTCKHTHTHTHTHFPLLQKQI